MYCKYCGKVISDDSKFCQHCGGNQDLLISDPTGISKQSESGNVVHQDKESAFITLVKKHKTCIIIYIVWVIVNLLLLLQGAEKIYEKTTFSSGALYGNTFHSNEVFYPFTSTGYQTSYMFNTKYYDWTELLVYCLLLPIMVYLLFIAWKSSVSVSVISKLDSFFDEKIKDNLMKATSDIESSNRINNKEKEDNHNESMLSKPNESSTIRFGSENNDESINYETSKMFLEFVITAMKTAAIFVISLFALVISLMYIHNFILGCVSSIIVGTIAYFLFKPKYFSEDSKHKRSPLYYTGLAISTLFILFLFYKFGDGIILSNINNPSQTPIDKKERVEKVLSMEEQYKSEIKIAKTKLPIVFDEYVSWTNIKRKPNGMLECDYLIDDANSDLYQIDLSKYKVELANKLKLISYKKYLELCMYAGHNLNCHLISKWDRSKSVDITFVNAEIGEILENNSLKSN